MSASTYHSLIVAAAAPYSVAGVDFARLLEAIVSVESGGDPNARGAAGEIGLAQLLPGGAIKSWEDSGHSRLNYFDPASNLKVAAWYLNDTAGSLAWAHVPTTVENIAAAYNAGTYRVVNKQIPASTTAYVAKVVKAYQGGAVQLPPVTTTASRGRSWLLLGGLAAAALLPGGRRR